MTDLEIQPPNPTLEEIRLEDAQVEQSRHAQRMQDNFDHYMAELKSKGQYACRVHGCFAPITEGGFCVEHNDRRWD
ncbi:hypothetical protein ACIRN4_06205 [Pimelobacter simplex]|uniref:hypothetical protein n=1 Tax=Nocardioides simplex TaxID=2045 RepID=UPI00381E1BDE